MPAMYAHDTFGRKVAAKLPLSVKQPILQYPQMFRVGLQGPDVLFFYNPFTEHPIGNVGRSLHKKTARSFLENAREIWKAGGEKVSQLSYLMGFLCHFMLDSACHPYIDNQIEKIGVGHIAIETEFERLLLLLDGKDPVSFPVGYCMPTDEDLAQGIAPFYPGVSVRDMSRSIRAMRRYKNLLVMPNQLLRETAKKGLHLVGQYNAITQHVIEPDPDLRCRITCEHLLALYRRTVPQAVLQEKAFVNAMGNGEDFDERLNRNFE